MRRAERSGSSGSSAAQPALDVRQVDPGVGAHEAVLGLADDQVAPPAQDPHRLALDERLVAERIVGVDGDEAALGLGHDLLGDDHDVAVGEVGRRVGDQAGEVVARPTSADALDAEDLERGSWRRRAASSTVGASAAATAGRRA